MFHRHSFACAVVVASLCVGISASVATADEQEIEVDQLWVGAVPESVFVMLPLAEQSTQVGYIDQEKIFLAFWKGMNGTERPPVIDFKKSIVLFVRNTREPRNLQKILALSDGHGVVTLQWHETVNRNTPANHVQCAMLVVDRSLVKHVKGNGTVVDVASTSDRKPTASR